MQEILIAVVGSGYEEDPRLLSKARQVGELLAESGFVLITGGLGGIMEAASAGARSKAGAVVGILPGTRPGQANRFVRIAIATGLGEARNSVIATAADALIAVAGEYGTLSEIALALRLGKPVITLDSQWSGIAGTVQVRSPEEAVEHIKSLFPGALPAGRSVQMPGDSK
jgi:uncharacterized protein (TIGR00725 family)